MSTVHASALVSALTPETTVGKLVAARPLLARLFERLGIDYCCGGKQTLAAACARRGLEVATIIALLDSTGSMLAAGPAEVDAAAMGLAELADHIVGTHHAYLKTELPRLVEMADRVATKHAWRDPRLPELAGIVRELAEEMSSHMQKEETVLFPLVRQLEAGAADGFHCGSIANPIRQMEAEHDSAGRLTARLRELTDGFTPNAEACNTTSTASSPAPSDGFTPNAEACNTHRALLAGLAEFESDLHRHVHKENNVLFPRALAIAAYH